MAAVNMPELPPLRGIYAGKIKDWSPELRAAGKLTATGDSVPDCLAPQPRPPSPDVVRRFRATFFPDAGKKRVFYGQANDPQRQVAALMRHGMAVRSEVDCKDMINPRPLTNFQQRCKDRQEALYESHARAPLGTSHDQRPGLPPKLDPLTFTFGLPTELDIGAGGLINPNRTYAEAVGEGAEFHQQYVRSHMDFYPGEQLTRSYTSPHFSPHRRFGKDTPHYNDGRKVKDTLKWIHETQLEKGAKIVSKRLDDFRERTQPQLGKVHDPLKDTMHLPPDHTFGVLIKPDQYGAGDVIHNRAPNTFARSHDQVRGIVSASRQHLKKMNYQYFDNILQAFKYYDKDNQGYITAKNLREVCAHFQLPVDDEVVARLLDACDHDQDGKISYLEFANFLNWKDKMPSGFKPFPADKTGDANAALREAGAEEAGLVGAGDLEPRTAQDRSAAPRRLSKYLDPPVGDPRTSASVVSATVGSFDTRKFRTYGTPSIRADLPAPRLRRINDTTNYGDEGDARALLHPSRYAERGLYEKDFLLPRSKEEIRDIFSNIGLVMTGDTLDKVWEAAASQHPKGEVSVESFRGVLDGVHGALLLADKHPYTIKEEE